MSSGSANPKLCFVLLWQGYKWHRDAMHMHSHRLDLEHLMQSPTELSDTHKVDVRLNCIGRSSCCAMLVHVTPFPFVQVLELQMGLTDGHRDFKVGRS